MIYVPVITICTTIHNTLHHRDQITTEDVLIEKLASTTQPARCN